MTTILSPVHFSSCLTPRNYSFHSPMIVDKDDNDDLTVLNAQIAALQAQLAILQAKRHSLIQKHILRALTPPSEEKPSIPLVARLAPELWGLIFQLTLEADSDSDSFCRSNANLLSLSAVCKRWRSIAQSTPQLWTNIVVIPPTSTSHTRESWGPSQHDLSPQIALDSVNNLLSSLANRITRSGALPFHLYLLNSRSKRIRKPQVFANGLSAHRKNESFLFQQAIWSLYNHLHRCRYVHVDDDMTDIWDALFSGLHSISSEPLVAPNLNTLLISRPTAISQTPSGVVPYWVDVAAGKLQLPSLHTLDISSPLAIPTLRGITIDGSQLRVLRWRSRGSTYGPPGFAMLADLLAQCTHLEECEIDHFPPAHRAPSNLITLPHLKKLTVKFALSEDPTILFSMVHTPELQSLVLEQTSPICHVLGLSSAIAEFLRVNANASASSQSLRSLTLSGLVLKDLDVSLFQALDDVRFLPTSLALTFKRCFLHEPFISQAFGTSASMEPMADDVDAPDIVPLLRLSSLTLHSTAFNPRLLRDVIQARDGLQVNIV